MLCFLANLFHGSSSVAHNSTMTMLTRIALLCLPVLCYSTCNNPKVLSNYMERQAGAELGQAHLKLGLDFTLIFVDLVW